MSENGASNVSQVLKAFQRLLSIYENPLWVKKASIEDIKTTFKLGNFVEKTICTFKAKEYLAQFLVLLEIWGKQNNLKSYTEEFFLLVNDRLMEKLFKYPDIKETTLDIAIRVYTSLYAKERFKECIKKLVLTSSSVRAISDFVDVSITDRTIIENKIILYKWSEYCKLGGKDALKSEVNSYLSLYNVEKKLPRLISLLALKEVTLDQEDNVRDLILEGLLDKMLDRSLLSKNFWLTLFRKLNFCHIAQVCNNYPHFLESLLNFIEYIGAMMITDTSSDIVEWTSDPSVCFCHEISYFELVIFLKIICCESNNSKLIVLRRLDKAKEYSNVDLWNQIIKDISEDISVQ